MCVFKAPKIPKTPPPAQYQQMQLPKEMGRNNPRNRMRRRGMWANIFTGPQGIAGPPTVTGGGGGLTGG